MRSASAAVAGLAGLLLLVGACASADEAAPGSALEPATASPTPTAEPLPTVATDDAGDPERELGTAETPTGAPDPADSEDTARPAGVVVIVTRVPDGDSFEVLIDGVDERVRLLGVNANEGDECYGPEAGEYLRSLIADQQVELLYRADDRDEFGRLLAFAYVGDVLVNEGLVAEGYAVARAQTDHPFVARFEAAEAAARDAGLGLWASDACGEVTDADVRIVDFEANAPGPDNENPNGEWVEIRNRGATTVDLGGWVIKDESTRHRYEFASGFAISPDTPLRLFSGCGDDSERAVYWCKVDDSVWNNSGDTIFLLDPSGNVVDSIAYSG